MKLSTLFATLIVGGFLTFILIVLLSAETICYVPLDGKKSDQATNENNNRPDALSHLIDESTLRVIAPSRQSDPIKHNSNSNQKIAETKPYPFICDSKITDIGIMFFTFCLAIVGWLGIKSSEHVVRNVERARFHVVVNRHNLTEIVDLVNRSDAHENSSIPGGDNIWVTYQFRNYGKTPGIIRELIIDSVVAPISLDPLPLPISIRNFPEHMIGGDGTTTITKYSPRTAPIVSQARAIGRNASHFWLFGRLYYDDVFGNPQVHRFYFRSVTSDGRCVLQPFEYKNYNKST